MVARIAALRTGRLARRLPDRQHMVQWPDLDLTVEGSMQTRDGHQKGPQEHAEGQHGERTRSRFLEQIRHPLYSDDDEPSERDGASEIGRGDR
jgi:hypothetical protein